MKNIVNIYNKDEIENTKLILKDNFCMLCKFVLHI